jgi:dCMP deaminase
METDWDKRFLDLALHISKWSKDPSTKVGCVIVGPDKEIRSTGFNGFPRGIDDNERLHDREQKVKIICHAEENGIMHAARIGLSLKGCTIYATHPTCVRCARSIIQAGIRKVVYYDTDFGSGKEWDAQVAIDLLIEAKILIRRCAMTEESGE